MDDQPYLLFTLNGGQYGIAAQVVQELFFLPALTPIPEAAVEVAGVLNLRGRMIPVIDLNQRLGQPRQPYTIKHVVILISLGPQTVGLIVEAVHNVEFLDPANDRLDLESHFLSQVEQTVTAGLATHQNQLITLLKPEALMVGSRYRIRTPQLAPETVGSAPVPSRLETGCDHFLAQFSAQEQTLLKDRALALTIATETETFSGLTALAIVGLQGEHFALGLETVHEFTDVSQITPIPCCPGHIVGNMNLRGEILTLVDIRQFLNLEATAKTGLPKAVITRIDQLIAGILVDEVFDVVYVRPSEIAAIPAAIHSADNEYLKGVAPYNNQMMSILDLPKLLTQGELVVNQTV